MKIQISNVMQPIFVATILIFATSAIAQERGFNSFDADRDKMINEAEFSKMYTASYNEYDLDRDGQINDREFYDYSFNRLDKNNDGELDSSEWKIGYDNVYNKYIKPTANAEFDADKNQRISKNEYYESFRNTNYYSDYDRNEDRFIDADELRARMYQDFDLNEDGLIDADEYTTKRQFYLNN